MSNPLAVYLNDHPAGAVGAIELIEHLARENAGTDLGNFLMKTAAEIAEDKETLEDITGRVGVPQRPGHGLIDREKVGAVPRLEPRHHVFSLYGTGAGAAHSAVPAA